ARNEASLLALHAENAVVVHHPTGAEWDRAGMIATAHLAWRAKSYSYRVEPVATLGDSIGLCQRAIFTTGLDWGRAEVGPTETEDLLVVDVDASGRLARADNFAVDHLGDAIARLYERFAEMLPDGAERKRAAAIARSVGVIVHEIPDRWPFAPEIEVV